LEIDEVRLLIVRLLLAALCVAGGVVAFKSLGVILGPILGILLFVLGFAALASIGIGFGRRSP
jgi:hypothetical protein